MIFFNQIMIRQKSITQITIIRCYDLTPLLQGSMNYLKQFVFLVFVKENSLNSQASSFPSLSKSCPTKFKILSDKLEKKTCALPICMNCEIIAEVKLGEEDRNFRHLYNIF